MPRKGKRVAFAEVMPHAGKYSESVSDDRSEYNAGHPHELCKNDGAHDVSADLESVADVVAKLVAVAVNHLFKIKNNDSQKSVERHKHIILERLGADLPRHTAQVKINAAHQKNRKRR